ncbi:MAG: PilZ domain-containing protein [Alphaproteobacteria bacterium]
MSTADFFQQRSIDLRLGGRYSLASRYDTKGNRREFACRTSRVSPYQMLVSVPVLGPVGERVVTYFGDFGNIDGWITNLTEGGFLLDIELPRQRREKFVAQLSWLKKHQEDAAVIDSRAQRRIVPQSPHSILIFGDGTTLNCLIIDVSPSGVAVSADVEPEIGTRLAVGRCVGTVVRRFAEGFAIQFDLLQRIETLEYMITPPKDLTTYAQRAGFVSNGAQPVSVSGPRPQLPERWYVG